MLPTAPRLFFAALCLCAVLLPNSQAAPPNPGLTPQQIAAIDHFISAEMAREHIPGLAVGIYSRGQILLAKGYGLSNIELNVPVKPETIFQSGSVGKQFTSAAIMLLVEENKISLEDSLAKFFPGAPASWQAIKIKISFPTPPASPNTKPMNSPDPPAPSTCASISRKISSRKKSPPCPSNSRPARSGTIATRITFYSASSSTKSPASFTPIFCKNASSSPWA
jgi:hypothetical protein